MRQPSELGNQVLGLCGYSYATPSNDETPRRTFVNAAVTEVYTQTASPPALDWKDAPASGHLVGTLTPIPPCPSTVDSYPLALTGPDTRSLLTDGSGWFGAVDLPPGDYVLSVEDLDTGVTISQPVTIVAGATTEQTMALRHCSVRELYLPLILRPTNR